MLKEFIATFHSHYGSMKFKKMCDSLHIQSKMMPVPRKLSSSCGTCVLYKSESYILNDAIKDDLEQIILVENAVYTPIFVMDE